MKITFVMPLVSTNGGIRVVATHARILHARGHDVTVISQAGRPPAGWKPLAKRLLGMRKRHAAVPSPLLDFLGPKHRILGQRRPLDAGDVPDADVVVATWWATAEHVAALPPSKGQKFYLLQDYEVFPNLPADRVIATYHLPLWKIAVSQYIRHEIETNHGAQVVGVVPNAVDLDQFAAPIRNRNEAVTVGFLYTHRPRKNIALAIEAIRLAKTRRPDLRVKVFGSKPPMPPCRCPLGSTIIKIRRNRISPASTPPAMPGCSPARRKGSGCPSSRRWPVGPRFWPPAPGRPRT